MTSWVSATIRMRSPSPAPLRSTIARWTSSDRNLTIGPRISPPGSSDRWARPLAPNRRARSVSSSISRRVMPAMPGRDDRLDPPARRERVVEHAEPRRRHAIGSDERRSEVDQLHPEAHVGLVRPEPLDRLLVGHHRERRLEDRPVGDGRPRDLDRHRLDEGHDRRLVDEAHLEVELGELGLAVAAQVLVAIAPRDLQVAVDAGDHQQLLELLRALRQGVHGARLEAARHDEVAGALGRALDQGRRLDLDEAVRVVDLADRLDHPAAEHEPALHRLTADVEIAVLEAQDLVDRRVGLVDVEGRRLRLGQDLEGGRLELDRARRQRRVLGPGQSRLRRSPRPTRRTRSGPGWRSRGRRVHRPCR